MGFIGKNSYIPLIERLSRGRQFCSWQEWEAWQWLLKKMNNPIARNKFISYRMVVEEELKNKGTFSITVPMNKTKNAERPWIVNVILTQHGAFLLDYQIWYDAKGRYPSEKVTLTYTVIL